MLSVSYLRLACPAIAVGAALLLSGPYPLALAESTCALVTRGDRADQPRLAQPVPLQIKADTIDFPRRNVVHLKGYTQMVHGGHRVYADELIFDTKRQEAEARGLVTFQTPQGDLITTSLLRYYVGERRLKSGPANFVLASRDLKVLGSDGMVTAHGAAEQVTFEQRNVMRLSGVRLTTCVDGEDDVTFSAAELNIDLDRGFRTARHVKLQILHPNRHLRLRERIN